MIKEIAELEANISAAKYELHCIEMEVKLENHKKNVLVVKKDTLSRSIEFYKNKEKKMERLLSHQIAKQSKFSMASTCYGKLVESYSEQYIMKATSASNTNQPTSEEKVTSSFNSKRQTDDIQKEVADLQSKINENLQVLKALLADLQYCFD